MNTQPSHTRKTSCALMTIVRDTFKALYRCLDNPTSSIFKRQSFDLFRSPPRGLIEPRTKFDMSALEKILKRLTDFDHGACVAFRN